LKLVLDTNVYCDFAEGLQQTVDVIARHGQHLFLPAVVIGELSFGFMKGKRQEYNEGKLQEIVDALGIEVIGVDASVARKYGGIFLSLQKKGKKIPINDVWIAACCMEVGGTLLTRDQHFAVVEQIDSMILS
jgi:tRNA(fMet)-specific endonuclease VapC